MRALQAKNKELEKELSHRLGGQNQFYNTEDYGYIQLDEDNDRERTLKVT